METKCFNESLLWLIYYNACDLFKQVFSIGLIFFWAGCCFASLCSVWYITLDTIIWCWIVLEHQICVRGCLFSVCLSFNGVSVYFVLFLFQWRYFYRIIDFTFNHKNCRFKMKMKISLTTGENTEKDIFVWCTRCELVNF